MEQLQIPHNTSRPYRHENNGVIERAIRRINEGTSCNLYQSGLFEQWWPWAMRCYCFARNVTDRLWNDLTPYEMRFGSSPIGPILPFGVLCEYMPDGPDDRLPAFCKKQDPEYLWVIICMLVKFGRASTISLTLRILLRRPVFPYLLRN